ncbi:hypothetical protein [Psychrobacter faecalis]|uniref:hypothetical protein n=1 Tax=Psychrobacter faecalis TaxID=180588 RepID=UPI003FCF52F0
MSDLSGPELNKARVKSGLDLLVVFTDGSTEYGAYNYIVQNPIAQSNIRSAAKLNS